MTATENSAHVILRTVSGSKTHATVRYAEGDFGRYAYCGADTHYARVTGETVPTCKKCAKKIETA